jgi:integrase
MTTSDRWLPKEPSIRAGLYRCIDNVPEHYRFRNYSSRFQGQDTWAKYLKEENICRDDHSQGYLDEIDRRESRWKKFCTGRVEHHALCTPSHAEEYAVHLFNEYDLEPTTASTYWATIERFYRWMFYHTEYPHRYNPFVMAAVQDEQCEELWLIAIESN